VIFHRPSTPNTPVTPMPTPTDPFEAGLLRVQAEIAEDCSEGALPLFTAEADLLRSVLVRERAAAPRPPQEWEDQVTATFFRREATEARERAAQNARYHHAASQRLAREFKAAREREQRRTVSIPAPIAAYGLRGALGVMPRTVNPTADPDGARRELEGMDPMSRFYYEEQEANARRRRDLPGVTYVPGQGADRTAAQTEAMRARLAAEDASQPDASEPNLLAQERELRLAQDNRDPHAAVWVGDEAHAVAQELADEEDAVDRLLAERERSRQASATTTDSTQEDTKP
jgi:hypothetical protein